MSASSGSEREQELALLFGVPDGGRYLNDWKTRADEYKRLREREQELMYETYIQEITNALRIVKRRDYGNLNGPDHIDERTTARVIEDALALAPAVEEQR